MSALRYMTAGESHGPCLTGIIEGIPAGLRLDLTAINAALAKRQKGYGRGDRMKIESDTAEILSGVRFGETLGSPITVMIKNRDFANWTERMAAFGAADAAEKVTAARPGHADLAGVLKYNRRDVRDILERSSARETAMRVALGEIARQFLEACGVVISSRVTEIGGVKVSLTANDVIDEELNCADKAAATKMKELIDAVKTAGDTVGGKFIVTATNLPVGLGSHIQYDRRLDAKLAAALMSIQAMKAVEIGAGCECARLLGSKVHDEIYLNENGAIKRKTNNAGGLEGGMTNGEPLVIAAVMKPIPTLMKPLDTINIENGQAVSAAKERSDVCAVPAASVVGEAMTALTLAEAILDKFGGDALADTLAAVNAYRERVKHSLPTDGQKR